MVVFYSAFVSHCLKSPAENSPSWTDRFQVVLHVARQVQASGTESFRCSMLFLSSIGSALNLLK